MVKNASMCEHDVPTWTPVFQSDEASKRQFLTGVCKKCGKKVTVPA